MFKDEKRLLPMENYWSFWKWQRQSLPLQSKIVRR